MAYFLVLSLISPAETYVVIITDVAVYNVMLMDERGKVINPVVTQKDDEIYTNGILLQIDMVFVG